MDEAVYEAMRQVLTTAGHSEASAADLAYHVALHFPEHGVTLLRAEPVEVTPTLPEHATMTDEEEATNG